MHYNRLNQKRCISSTLFRLNHFCLRMSLAFFSANARSSSISDGVFATVFFSFFVTVATQSFVRRHDALYWRDCARRDALALSSLASSSSSVNSLRTMEVRRHDDVMTKVSYWQKSLKSRWSSMVFPSLSNNVDSFLSEILTPHILKALRSSSTSMVPPPSSSCRVYQ